MNVKMSRSEAGRIGGIKYGIVLRQQKLQRIETYNNNPTLCQYCEEPLDYEKRKNKFCSRSCAAKYNNVIYPKRGDGIYADKRLCLSCSKELTVSQKKYCSYACVWGDIMQERSESGNTSKNYLLRIREYKCEICGITEWNGKTIVLQMDHIDGNPDNNFENNLRLICPNCHSQTETFTYKNGGNKLPKTDNRNQRRRKRYYKSQEQDSNLREDIT